MDRMDYKEIIEHAKFIVDEFRFQYWGISPGRKLTEEETFAIAVISGVNVRFLPMDPRDPYILRAVTDKCSVFWDGEKFQVFSLAKNS